MVVLLCLGFSGRVTGSDLHRSGQLSLLLVPSAQGSFVAHWFSEEGTVKERGTDVLKCIVGDRQCGVSPEFSVTSNPHASSSGFPTQSALLFPPGHSTFPFTSSSVCFASPGKDARLFVFRLSAVQRGMESKQAVRSKCDCRENKLEKTKGGLLLPVLLVSVQLIFFPDCPDFTEN